MKTSLKVLAVLVILPGTLGFRAVSDIRPRSSTGTVKSVEKNSITVVEGVIDSLSVSRNAIVVNGLAVYLSARTVITAGDKTISFDALMPGMKVRAYGTVTPPSMTAAMLEVVTK